ncbi:MAG: hypothetical protein DUD32_12505 [Lactobacillus sp.]|nr:MAG: hypothetical protein DUD32_12505 [Lactobacillus sp.]
MAPTTANVEVGKTAKLVATISPDDATDKTGKWSIGDTSIATIAEDGTITGVKAGTTIATYTTTDGAKVATSTITVAEPVAG